MSVGPVARNEATEEFFDASAEGRLLIRRCPAGHASRPQVKACDVCASPDLSFAEASGRARLITWAVVPSPSPGGAPRIPAVGELEEGPWWWSAVVGADPDELRDGMALRIGFERAEGGEAVPVFLVDPS